MAMSTGGEGGVKAEPNVTPMIDVMLVLLIIFMIIVPALQSGMTAEPPVGQNLKPHPEDDKDVILGIDKDGQYFLQKKMIDNGSLGARLNDIYGAAGREDHVLYVKADKGLPYSKIIDALDVAAKNHVAKAALITDQAPATMSTIVTDNLSFAAPKGGAK